jgi:Cu+-exporting ATPase
MDETTTSAIDPVCGMTVERSAAERTGLVSTVAGTTYYFCGKGCKLDFDEEPERYLSPDHIPSM